MDFVVLTNQREIFKGSEKKDNYLDLDRELKNCGTWK